MRDRLTNLPPEVLTIVLSRLRPRALRQCLLVNSAFLALARPLLSRFLHLGSYWGDVSFPPYEDRYLAPTFVPLPPPQLFPQDISCLTVDWHRYCSGEKRESYLCLPSPPQISSCRVLNLRLSTPDNDDDLASVHRLNGHEESLAWDYEDGIFVRPLHCYTLHHALEKATIDKLVLRNVPVVYANVDPDLLDPFALQTVREAVIVLDVDSMSDANADQIFNWHYYQLSDNGEPICLQTNESMTMHYPEIGSLNTAFPPNAEELTIVFWTTKPAVEVAPSCCAAEAQYSYDDDNGREEGTSEDEDGHFSCWETIFWFDLADVVAPLFLRNLRRITIVNASSIIPSGSPWGPILASITTCVATHAKLEKKFRTELHKVLVAQHGIVRTEEYLNRVKFEYMPNWLRSTEWEDVFSWSEVKPWLEFKRPALITDYFKPVDPNAVKWRKDMDPMERISLRHRRSTMKRTKAEQEYLR